MTVVLAGATFLSHLFLPIFFLSLYLSKKNNQSAIFFVNMVKRFGLPIAFFMALFSTSMSIYLSEFQGLAPCLLCWYQRILMYPQVLVLFIGMLLRDRNVYKYIWALSIVGGLIAAYHIFEQLVGQGIISCGLLEVDCTENYGVYFGYITIPLMSFTGFVLTMLFSYYGSMKERLGGDTE